MMKKVKGILNNKKYKDKIITIIITIITINLKNQNKKCKLKYNLLNISNRKCYNIIISHDITA